MTSSGIGERRKAALGDGTGAYQQRRREIIEAAVKVFHRQGFRRTGLGDIAKVLGVDRATLYYYVGNKEELLEAAVTGIVVANTEELERIRDSEGAPVDKLRTIVESLMASFAEHYPLLYVYMQENLSHVAPERAEWANRMRAVNRRYQDGLTAIVQQGFDDGTLRAVGPAEVVANGIIGTVAWTNRWYDPNRSPYDAVTIGRSYSAIVVDGLRSGA